MSMELELGLALPIHTSPPPITITKGELDLNSKCGCADNTNCSKRSYNDAFSKNADSYNALSSQNLLVWDGHPNDDDDAMGNKSINSSPINLDNYNENHIIGWPPIKSSRQKELRQQHHYIGHRRRYVDHLKKQSTARIKVDALSSWSTSNSNDSTYVKVKMEGFLIARKVDLSLHRSYRTLRHALLSMFSNYDEECIRDSDSYKLTYQDKEGDWLLTGDVPWKSFVKSVRSLEIVRRK